MKNIFSNFTHCYPLQKTLRFSLIPQGKTEENIQKYGLLENDELKAMLYPEVKKIFDKYHKAYIDETLSTFVCDFEELFDTFDLYVNNKSKYQKAYKETSDKYQKMISEHLKGSKLAKSEDKFKELNPSNIIKSIVSSTNKISLTDEEIYAVKAFDNFSTYFSGYSEVRENIYSTNIAGSVAYRIICDNFPKFYWNCKKYNSIPDDKKLEFNSELKSLTSLALDEIFSKNYFINTITQQGLELYNTIIGGKTNNETSTKEVGLNELCNLYLKDQKIKFSPLYKQILSDRETASFIPTAYKNDIEVKTDIVTLCDYISESNIDSLRSAFLSDSLCLDKIYIDKKQLPFLSQLLFGGDWGRIGKALETHTVNNSETKSSKKAESITSKELFNLSDIVSSLESEDYSENILEDAFAAFEEAFASVVKYYNSEKAFLSDNSRIESFDNIKSILDEIQKAEKILKIFNAPDDVEKDDLFYSVFDEEYSRFRSNITVYNKVRNYATKKPYSQEKFKLNFNNYQLATGWDINKEKECSTFLLTRNGKYYLGVLKNRTIFEAKDDDGNITDDCFSKIIYKQIPNAAKYLSIKQIKPQNPPASILKLFEKGCELTKEDLCAKINYIVNDFLPNYAPIHDTDGNPYFNFEFKATENYSSWKEFCDSVDKQAYSLSFKPVSEKSIFSAIDEGKLFLFEIYSKDFSEKSFGKPNLHTLYFRELFSEENIKDPVFKLNGGAELFYRPASIRNPFVHKKGSVLINKKDKKGNVVDEASYMAATEDANTDMTIEELKNKHPSLLFRYAPHDITKDKRFSTPSYKFHVPITLNNATDVKYPKFNSAVLDAISENTDVNIIGIDRGERNLLYISVIDQNGNILEQRSLNSLNGINYHQKLAIIEKNRDNERKNWHTIENIKETKEGYLSLAVHEISSLMLKHNAIIALEDLNFSFKHGRFHIEKQVYQKFEKMLIDKLNYLADKSKTREEGGIANAYQLTNQFESFQKLGKQSGFLFYVPARYTSKIDPASGFVNLFTNDHLKYSSCATAADFISKFDSVRYVSEYDCFAFDFDYSKFNLKSTDYTNKWTAYTVGDDRVNTKIENGHYKHERTNVTKEMVDLFNTYNVDINQTDMKPQILKIDQKEFWKKLLWLLRLTLSLRHEDDKDDFILSPICVNGKFYDSRNFANTPDAKMPIDADANGAYHIALQGLRLLGRISDGKITADESGKQNYNWLKFAQTRNS